MVGVNSVGQRAYFHAVLSVYSEPFNSMKWKQGSVDAGLHKGHKVLE